MNKKVTINGIVYDIEDLNFGNLVADMEDQGVNVMELMDGKRKYVFSFCRAFIAIVTGLSIKKAGLLMTKHFANGGTADEFLNVFTELMSDAGFGRAETANAAPQKEEVTPEE